MTDPPWIRTLDMPEHGPLTRSDVEQLRAVGLYDVANIAEKYVIHRERKLRRPNVLRRLFASVPPDRKGSQ